MRHIKIGALLIILILCVVYFSLTCVSCAETDGTLVLPTGLKRVDSEAFVGVFSNTVIFPDGIEYIAPDAFSQISAGIGIGSADNTVAITWCTDHGWTYQAYPRYFALLIGNWNYSGMTPLSGIDNDINAMQNAISGLSQNWHITVTNNLNAEGIISAVSSTFSQATMESDVCLFYYSGHGDDSTTDTAGSLIGINGTISNNILTGHVLPSVLCSTIDNATPGKVIVIMDSCGSGAPIYEGEKSGTKSSSGGRGGFTRAVINAFRGKTVHSNAKTGEMLNKYAVLAACEYGKTSQSTYVDQQALDAFLDDFESGLFMNGSAFTYSLVHTMGCGYPSGSYSGTMTGDSNNDGKLSLSEAYRGVGNQVNGMNAMIKEAYRAWYYETYETELPEDAIGDYYDQVVQMSGPDDFVLFERGSLTGE